MGWEALLAALPSVAKVLAGAAFVGAIAGAVALARGWIRRGASAEVRADEAKAREVHHEEAEKQLDKPVPTGAKEILARREARRRRRERFGD